MSGESRMRHFIFIVIVLVVTYLIYVYPAVLLFHLLFGTELFNLYSLWLTVLFAGLVFVYLRTHLSTPILRGFIHYGLGLGFLGFCIFNAGFIISLFQPDISAEIGVVSMAAFLLINGFSIKQGRDLKVVPLVVKSRKIARPTSLIFISDVHLGSNPRGHVEKICNTIKPFDADYVLIGGDLFDSSAFQPSSLISLIVLTISLITSAGG